MKQRDIAAPHVPGTGRAGLYDPLWTAKGGGASLSAWRQPAHAPLPGIRHQPAHTREFQFAGLRHCIAPDSLQT